MYRDDTCCSAERVKQTQGRHAQVVGSINDEGGGAFCAACWCCLRGKSEMPQCGTARAVLVRGNAKRRKADLYEAKCSNRVSREYIETTVAKRWCRQALPALHGSPPAPVRLRQVVAPIKRRRQQPARRSRASRTSRESASAGRG